MFLACRMMEAEEEACRSSSSGSRDMCLTRCMVVAGDEAFESCGSGSDEKTRGVALALLEKLELLLQGYVSISQHGGCWR